MPDRGGGERIVLLWAWHVRESGEINPNGTSKHDVWLVLEGKGGSKRRANALYEF